MNSAIAVVKRKLAVLSGRIGVGPLVVLTSAALLVVMGITRKPFQADEAYIVMFSRWPLGELLAAVRNDVTPPLHFVALRMWGLAFGDGVGSLRVLSAACVTGSVALTMLLGTAVGSRRGGCLAGAVLAGLPLVVSYGQVVKADSLAMLLVVALAYAALRACRAAAAWKAWLMVAVLYAAVLYAYYLAAFSAFALVATPAFWSKTPRRDTVRMVLALACGGLLFLPWVPSLVRQMSSTSVVSVAQVSVQNAADHTGTSPTTNQVQRLKAAVKGRPALRMLVELLLGQRPLAVDRRSGGRAALPLVLLSIAALVAGVAAYLGAFGALVRSARRVPVAPLAFAALWLVPLLMARSALELIYHGQSLTADYATPHHFLWLLPFVCLVTAFGLEQLPKRAGFMLAALLVGANLVQTIGWYRAWSADSRAVAAFLERRWRPGDAVLLEAWSGVEIRVYQRDRLASMSYVNYAQYPWARARVVRYREAGVLRGQQLVTSDSLSVSAIGRDIDAALSSVAGRRVWSVTIDAPPDDSRVPYTGRYRDALSRLARSVAETHFDGMSVGLYVLP